MKYLICPSKINNFKRNKFNFFFWLRSKFKYKINRIRTLNHEKCEIMIIFFFPFFHKLILYYACYNFSKEKKKKKLYLNPIQTARHSHTQPSTRVYRFQCWSLEGIGWWDPHCFGVYSDSGVTLHAITLTRTLTLTNTLSQPLKSIFVCSFSYTLKLWSSLIYIFEINKRII